MSSTLLRRRCVPAGEEAERLALGYLTVEVDSVGARVAWLAGRRDEAVDLAGRVFERLGQPELIGALQPGEIYLSCRDVLIAYDDPRPPRRRQRAGSTSSRRPH